MVGPAEDLYMDAWHSDESYDQEVVCEVCGDALIVRFAGTEPVDGNAMACHCGGGLRVA